MTPVRPRSIGFPLACALGYAGGVVAYFPLLTLLLPMQVARSAGADRYAVLADVLAVGAIAAGGSSILFGWLSDRSRRRGGGRRRWIAAGLVATLASFAIVPFARTPLAIVIAIALFQTALNALLAPLMALVAEEVPEDRMGLTTGLFAGAPPLASLLSLGLAVPLFRGEGDRLAVIGGVAAICLLPLLASRSQPAVTAALVPRALRPRRDLALAWLARLLVQVAGAVLFADVLYLMEEPVAAGADARLTMARLGSLLIVANLVPLPVSVLFGRWSDRVALRKPFLVATAVVATLGLVLMAAASTWNERAAGLLVFSVGWGSFLPLQIGSIMRLLPDPAWRGRDLGVVNLANTLPVLIGQGLVWGLATPHHAGPLLLTLAVIALAGGMTMLAIDEGR